MESITDPPSTLPASTLIKGLASCDAKTRSKTLKTLTKWLPSQTLISDETLKKLWKSLFYTLWHCDTQSNQSNLISLLSSFVPSLSTPLSLSYFSHFLVTIRREWPGIDHLRLDKFYLLIRFMVRNLFVLMKDLGWDLGVLDGFVRVLEEKAFFYVGDNGLGNGVTYHVVDVFCDEIRPFLPLKVEALELLFRPILGCLGKCDSKVLVGKVKGSVFDRLVRNGKELVAARKAGMELEEGSEVVVYGTVALGMGFAARFYELGSDPGCVQGNRKVLFGLHEEFLRLEKEKDVVGCNVGWDVEEVPESMLDNGEKVKGNGKSKEKKKKTTKKKKKSKKSGVNDEDGSSGSGGGGGDSEMGNANDDGSNVETGDGENDEIVLSEMVMSNLQKQFEKIAAESGLHGDGTSALDASPSTVQVSGKAGKKRKRSKSAVKAEMGGGEDGVEETASKTGEKSGKRVRFSDKNLIWKPQTPLPPQSLRIPPSVTPRGSALKKGLSPGPIRDTTKDGKKAKKKRVSPLKKARKVKSISPAGKKKKKVRPMSA